MWSLTLRPSTNAHSFPLDFAEDMLDYFPPSSLTLTTNGPATFTVPFLSEIGKVIEKQLDKRLGTGFDKVGGAVRKGTGTVAKAIVLGSVIVAASVVGYALVRRYWRMEMGKEKEKGKGRGGKGDKSGTGHRGEMEEKGDEKIQRLRASSDDGKTDENGRDWADAADLENASTDVAPSSSSKFS